MSIGSQSINSRKKKIVIEPFFPQKGESNETIPQITKVKATEVKSANQNRENKNIKSEKKSPISGLGISISALSKGNDQQPQFTEIRPENTLCESFTPLELLNQWKSYAESITEEQHLRNTMLNCLPDLQSRDVFEVVVNNPVQEQRLIDNSLSILSVLRENLKNFNIQMKVRVSVENEKKLGFTSLEKFNLMTEQNESLKKLKDEFGLELM